MQVSGKPIIGIVLDENTSQGGFAYDTGKGYFRAIARAGGVAVGLPYAPESVAFARGLCAGLMSTGARIAFPEDWYVQGDHSPAPASERFEIERALVEAFLALDRPYLGICNGMQMLGCLSGCLMSGNAKAHTDGQIAHDDHATRHSVTLTPHTRLHNFIGKDEITVNSFHREAILVPSDQIRVSARAPDGLIEAIERPDKTFALGIQWHPERLLDETPDALTLFEAFVSACRG